MCLQAVLVLATQGPRCDGKNAEDEDDYEVLDAALKEISEKQGTRKNKFERKVGEDGNLHWVAATPVTEGKNGEALPTAEAEEEQVVVAKLGFDGLVRRMSKSGALSFIPANEAVIQVSGTGLSGMTPELLARASALPFKKKLKWFRQCRDKLRVPWEQGHKKIRIDRSNILYESMANFQRFKKVNENEGGRNDLHKTFRFQFTGEEGIDAVVLHANGFRWSQSSSSTQTLAYLLGQGLAVKSSRSILNRPLPTSTTWNTSTLLVGFLERRSLTLRLLAAILLSKSINIC